jgi:hypothetical protein
MAQISRGPIMQIKRISPILLLAGAALLAGMQNAQADGLQGQVVAAERYRAVQAAASPVTLQAVTTSTERATAERAGVAQNVVAERRVPEGHVAAERRVPEGHIAAERRVPEGHVAAERRVPEGHIAAERRAPEGHIAADRLFFGDCC